MKEQNPEKMKEQSKETKKEEQSPERKYAELTSYIKILSYRATSQKGEKVGKRLREIATYLDEIRKQRHLCMMSESDRIENVRFREILEYVNGRYDGTESSVKDICKALNQRKDVNEVLKYHKNEKEESER